MVNLVITLLNHSRLSFWRSKTLDRSLATAIFTWLMIGMVLMYALALGFMLPKILANVAPDTNPVSLVNSLLFFYWLIEVILRLVWQRNVTLNAQYYLTQNIPRQALTHYMLLKRWGNLFLLLALLIFGPFAVRQVAPLYDAQTAWLWLGFILLTSFWLHHLVIALQQYSQGKMILPLLLGATLFGVIYLDAQGYFKLTAISEQAMTIVMGNPVLILPLAALVAASYYLDFWLVKNNLSLDSLPQDTAVAGAGISQWVTGLTGYGIIGQLVSLELRLIWRNRRARTMAYMSIFLSLYFLFFITRTTNVAGVFLLFATGAFMINYGQLLFSWESRYFDFLLTRNFSMQTYLKAKLALLVGANTVLLLFNGLILAIIRPSLLPDMASWYLLNSGFFVYLHIAFTMLSAKRIDANARAMFNYEGMNAGQFLIFIPYFLVVGGIFSLVAWLSEETWRWLVVAAPGLLGLLFYRSITGWLAHQFSKRKYKISDGFRE